MISVEDILKTLHSRLDDSARLSVIDESAKHAGHLEKHEINGISHVFIDITWNGFKTLSILQRQRMLNQWLEEFFQKGLHSVRYKLKTFEE